MLQQYKFSEIIDNLDNNLCMLQLPCHLLYIEDLILYIFHFHEGNIHLHKLCNKLLEKQYRKDHYWH